jgi:hypothetical protein
MSARLESSIFSSRHSAKLALAVFVAISGVALVTFTVRAWREKPGSTANQNLIIAQPTPVRGRLQNRL